jgi:hypothetical protein
MDRWFIDRRRERTQPDDTDSNPKLTFRADHQVGRRERYPDFISLAPRSCCRDDLSNAISMSAASRIGSTRKAVALFNRTSNGVGRLWLPRYEPSGPMSLPSIPHASRRVRPSTFDRRHRVARTTGAQTHANSIRGDGLRRRNEYGLRSPLLV